MQPHREGFDLVILGVCGINECGMAGAGSARRHGDGRRSSNGVVVVIRDRISILITDDDLGFRETLQSLFEPRGFRTLLAGDGEQALAIVRNEPVHVVVTDMHMPRLSGLEMIREATQLVHRLPCILLSANMDIQLAAAAREARAYSVLAKPVRGREMTRLVDEALRQTYGWPEF